MEIHVTIYLTLLSHAQHVAILVGNILNICSMKFSVSALVVFCFVFFHETKVPAIRILCPES